MRMFGVSELFIVIMVTVLAESADKKCSRCSENQCLSNGQCTRGCKNGYFMDLCNRTCRSQCLNRTCAISKLTGSPECTHGCVPGYRGVYCELLCPSRCKECTYSKCLKCEQPWTGQKCDIHCGHCESMSCFENRTCKARSVCSSRCSYCSSSRVCLSCQRGNYGNNCTRNCSDTCVGRACDMESGRCLDGCEPGWSGFTCDFRSRYLKVDDPKPSPGLDDAALLLTSIGPTLLVPRHYSRENLNKEATVVISVGVSVAFVFIIVSIVLMKHLFCNKCKKGDAPRKDLWQRSEIQALSREPIYDEIKENHVLTPDIRHNTQMRPFSEGHTEDSVYISPVKSSDERQSENNIYLTPVPSSDSFESEQSLLNPEEHDETCVDVSSGTNADVLDQITISDGMTSHPSGNEVGKVNDAFRLSPKQHRKWTTRMEFPLPERAYVEGHLTIGRASPITV